MYSFFHSSSAVRALVFGSSHTLSHLHIQGIHSTMACINTAPLSFGVSISLWWFGGHVL